MTDENPKPYLTTYTKIMLAVVIILGFLLVIGTGVVIFTIIDRLSGQSSDEAAITQFSQPPAYRSLPDRATVERFDIIGRDMLLHIREGKRDLFILIDPKTGAEKNRVIIP